MSDATTPLHRASNRYLLLTHSQALPIERERRKARAAAKARAQAVEAAKAREIAEGEIVEKEIAAEEARRAAKKGSTTQG